MVNFVIRYRLEILILAVLAIGYFILRLPNLTLQPIFADEAIYIRSLWLEEREIVIAQVTLFI